MSKYENLQAPLGVTPQEAAAQILKSSLKKPKQQQRDENSSNFSLGASEDVSPSIEKRKRRRRRVSFGRIEIEEHAYELGDNPSVTDGAPLTIVWEVQNRTVFELEYYEAYHPSEDRRRKESGLALSVSQRAEILLRAGYSMAAIVGCTLEMLKEKSARTDSYRHRKWDAIHEAIEITSRKIRRAGRRSALHNTTVNPATSTSTASSFPTINHDGSPEQEPTSRKMWRSARRSSLGTSTTTCSSSFVPGPSPSFPTNNSDGSSPTSTILKSPTRTTPTSKSSKLLSSRISSAGNLSLLKIPRSKSTRAAHVSSSLTTSTAILKSPTRTTPTSKNKLSSRSASTGNMSSLKSSRKKSTRAANNGSCSSPTTSTDLKSPTASRKKLSSRPASSGSLSSLMTKSPRKSTKKAMGSFFLSSPTKLLLKSPSGRNNNKEERRSTYASPSRFVARNDCTSRTTSNKNDSGDGLGSTRVGLEHQLLQLKMEHDPASVCRQELWY